MFLLPRSPTAATLVPPTSLAAVEEFWTLLSPLPIPIEFAWPLEPLVFGLASSRPSA